MGRPTSTPADAVVVAALVVAVVTALAPVVALRPWMTTTIVHVWPDNDRMEHELWPGCPCEPSKEVVTEKGPRQGLIFTHKALDGRQT